MSTPDEKKEVTRTKIGKYEYPRIVLQGNHLKQLGLNYEDEVHVFYNCKDKQIIIEPVNK